MYAIHQLSELIEPNSWFQSSVHLQLDCENGEKVIGYIPTRSSVQILKRYLRSINGEKDEKGTILIGPYGKGKSHLLLVILYLISMYGRDGYETTMRTLISHVKEVDEETAVLIQNYVNQKKRMLPIFITSTEQGLYRGFLIGLSEALKRNQLTDLLPDTYYREALRVIENWRADYPQTYGQLVDKLEQKKWTVERLQSQLQHYDEKSLQWFQTLYPELTAGSVFNPLINTEIIALYRSVNEGIQKRGYSGIFVAFDEFSKFMEGLHPERVGSDMKILQDMCELANHSDSPSLHLTLVTHKSIKEYGNRLPSAVQNAYTGIEGRLSEIYFVVSSKNNYELVEHAIQEKPKLEEEMAQNDFLDEVYQQSGKLPIFQSLFSEREFREIILRGCFPLSPIAVYVLIGISERIAQNERTLFTFLTKDEPNGLVHFCRNHRAGENPFLGLGEIYDYFYPLFKKEVSDEWVHGEWLKVEYALQQVSTEQEAVFLKTLGMIRMLNRENELPANRQVLRAAMMLPQERMLDEQIEALEKKQLIVKRRKDDTYAFRNQIHANLDAELENIIRKQFETVSLSEELNQLNFLRYELPKRYNQEYRMTRFFSWIFMDLEAFLSLMDAEVLFEQKFSDGKLIGIILDKQDDEIVQQRIWEKVQDLADGRVIVVNPHIPFAPFGALKKLLAVQVLEKNKEFLDENKGIDKELALYEDDLREEITLWIEQHYAPENGMCNVYHSHIEWQMEEEWNVYLSRVIREEFYAAPKINHELVNRRVISAQYAKARAILSNAILEKQDVSNYQKGTSPEATMYRAVFVHTGLVSGEVEPGMANVLREIERFLERAEGKRISIWNLYRTLLHPPYGVRLGVLPLLLAYELAKREQMPILYYQNREILCNGENLSLLEERIRQSYLFCEKGSAKKEAYLDGLETLFGVQGNGKENRMRYRNLFYEMQRWYRSLPACAVRHQFDLARQQTASFCKLFQRTDGNVYDILMERIPQLFSDEGLQEDTVRKVEQVKTQLETYEAQLTSQMIRRTKECLGGDETENLADVLREWYERQIAESHAVYERKTEDLIQYIGALHSYDEEQIMRRLSKLVMGIYLSDWNDESEEVFGRSLETIKAEVSEKKAEKIENVKTVGKILSEKTVIQLQTEKGEWYQKQFQSEKDSDAVFFFKNEIERLLEEYAQSMTTLEQWTAMAEILQKLFLEG